MIRLLRADGIHVLETTLTCEDVLAANELSSMGNQGKVSLSTRNKDRELEPGPVLRRARECDRDFTRTAWVEG